MTTEVKANIMRIFPVRLALVLVSLGVVCGCASTRQCVPRPDESQITKATVIVELRRPNELIGSIWGFKVKDNDNFIGILGPGQSLKWERAPGTMSLVVEPTIDLSIFLPIDMDLLGAHKYTFSVSYPFWYPFDIRAITYLAAAPLAVTKELPISSPTGQLREPSNSRATVVTQTVPTLEAPALPTVGTSSTASTPANTDEVKSIPRPHMFVSVRMEDDPAKSDTVIGNGDGIIQKGEAFDLVTTVTNAGTSVVQAVNVHLIMARGIPLKCFSKTIQSVGDLTPAASATVRFNLALPLSAVMTQAPVCTIMAKATNTEFLATQDFKVPIERP